VTAENASPLPSSSVVSQSVDFEVDVDFDRMTDRRRQQELVHFPSVAALVDAITMNLGLAHPEARHVVDVFGAGRTERAYLKTRWDTSRPDSRIRRKIGWFLGALREGKEWSLEEVKEQLAWQGEQRLKDLEASDNETERRLAREERQRRGGKVVSLQEAKR
jgi:hypothetical protein